MLKADSLQGPLVSLGSTASEQPSTSKQQYTMEQQLYGASGSREDIFTLGAPSYMTSSKNCGSRSLGYDPETPHAQEKLYLQETAVLLHIRVP